jgi:hypothetical protein
MIVTMCAIAAGCSPPSRAYPVDSAVVEPVVDTSVIEAAAPDLDATVDVEGFPFVRCGEPPYVGFTYLFNDDKRKPLKDVRVQIDLCPALPQITGSDGTVRLMLPRGKPLYMIIEHTPLRLFSVEGEYAFELPGGITSYLLSPSMQVPLPRPDEARLNPVMYIDSTRPAPCNDGNGVSYSVKDHPEAIVTYYDATGPIPGATETADGHWNARIGGIAPGTYVQLEAHKAGCHVTTYVGGADLDQNTGRSPLVAGHDSLVTVVIESLPTVDAGPPASDAGIDAGSD